jgi:hypothetical protein
MDLRAVIALAALFCTLTAATGARAWQETHQTGGDVRLRVDPDGMASVEDVLRWRVVRGPVKSIDLLNVAQAATLDPDVSITADDGRELTGHLVRIDEKTVRILVDQPKALMRGVFAFRARWRVELGPTHALAFDGATWRLTWSSPVAADGFDGARTVLDLPAAPDEPRAILADTGAIDDTAVTTLHREDGRDVLEMIRPHVARGQSVGWTVRIDPRALAAVHDPTVRTLRVEVPREPDRVRLVSVAFAIGLAALAFGLLVGAKDAAFGRACAELQATSRGLLRMARTPRAVLAGLAFGGAIGLELWGTPLWASLLVAVSAIAAAEGKPVSRLAVRGPGRWLALRPDEAFARRSGAHHWLDIDAPAGKLALAALALAALVLAIVARRYAPEGPCLVALDSAALLPLFVTGRVAQLPPEGGMVASPWLEPVFRRLQQIEQLRAVPWARVTLDGSTVDELRLKVVPRSAMPGLSGIELGLAWSSTPVGWSASPEVLVRVLEGSAAAARLSLTPSTEGLLPGRRTDERVLRVAPRSPTPAGALALTRAFVEALTDRRATAVTWTAPERRVPRRPPAAIAA